MGRICVVGSINMDLVISTPRIPVMGETIIGSGFFTAPGGKGANQAVAAARLGGKVVMIGCVGNDIFGDTLIKSLNDNNIDTSCITAVRDLPTGIAVITIKDGDNFIILDTGANYALTPQSIGANERIIKECDIMLLQLEIPQDTVDKAVETAASNGVKVILNPAPARRLTDEILRKIDVFVVNESECEYYSGIKVNSKDNASKAIDYLRAKGIKQVVVTLGEKGVVFNAGNAVIDIPAMKVDVVDTTAAGDSFIGAMSVALTKNLCFKRAIFFANAVAALTVTKKGAQTSLPTLDEVRHYVNLNNINITLPE